jgi:hypothetical protein
MQKERGDIEKSICSRGIEKKCAPIKEHRKKVKHDPPPK